jgi:hypothetical protein
MVSCYRILNFTKKNADSQLYETANYFNYCKKESICEFGYKKIVQNFLKD